jgi:transcriptional regulator with XRE-family HTH domain
MRVTAAIRSISGSIIESPVDVQSSSVNVWVGCRLRIRREWLGISDQELCESLGIDCDEIGAYEAGKKRIRAKLLFRIAKLLDVRPAYFFQGYQGQEIIRLPNVVCRLIVPAHQSASR